MIELKDSAYIVKDTNTKELISRHEFTNERTRLIALDEAKAKNEEWKQEKSAT